MISGRPIVSVVCSVVLLLASTTFADVKERDTIKSLEKKTVALRPGKTIAHSFDLARENYRAFLDLVSDDSDLRAEAMRRLGDLELEATEAEQLATNIDTLDYSGYDNAVTLYQRLLESYPRYRRNDTVLYQLGRAYETSGRPDDALHVLDELVARYPDTPIIDEVEFRRGEMLFLRKQYNDSEAAYQRVVRHGETSRYYEQSLYKLGWSQFKLGWHGASLEPFFELLDRKIGNIELKHGDARLDDLSRAERELVEDTFRVLSISFSYMDSADSINAYFDERGHPAYSYVIYINLGELYLDKERYVDAADAYGAFVDRYPYHAKAPLLQVEVIEAYKRGRFPSLVLEGKRDFVERYGMDGEFWRRNPPEDNTAVAAHLKANLNDLAQYYHAEAQRDGKRSDYQEAARWYRKYLTYFPGEPDSANTNFLLAEILFEGEQFEAATIEFERTAYEYPVNKRSAEAGYAAILSYREHEKGLADQQQVEWHQGYLDSSLRFADTYPDHPETAAVLTTVAEDLFAQDEFDKAIVIGRMVVVREPPVKAPLARTSWTVIAHSHFDLRHFDDAEAAYYKLRTYVPDQDRDAMHEIDDRIASSIYKQGELSRSAGDLESAVAHFTRLGHVVPDSDIRETAEYDAAAALINLEAWNRATGILEQFRHDYPDSEFSEDITQKLAVSYLNSGRGTKAAAEYERIAVAETSSDEVRREALWKAAELYKQGEATDGEKRVLENVIARYPDPLSESIEARYRLVEIAASNGDNDVRMAGLQDIVTANRHAGEQSTDRMRFLAAKASIELADPIRRRFEVLKLTQPLAKSIKLKKKLMEDAIAAYAEAAKYGVAEVTTAATYQLGQVYEVFGADLIESERPGDLDAEALDQYELLLEEQAFPFEEKAIDLYKANTGRAADGVFDEWVRRSFVRLAGLMPARYAKVERSEDVVTALY